MSIAVRDLLSDKSLRLTMEANDFRFTTACRSMFVRSSSHPRTGESKRVLDGAPTNEFTRGPCCTVFPYGCNTFRVLRLGMFVFELCTCLVVAAASL